MRYLALLPVVALFSQLGALKTRDFAHLPQRPFNAALGGQSAHTMPTQAAALVNPAFLGYGDQNTFFTGGVFSPHLYGFYADGALFSPYGGLTLSAEYFKADDQTGALSFSYGSFLSRRVATGLAVTPRYTTGNGQQAFGLGIDPALLFDSKWHANLAGNDGLGLYSPTIFLRTLNLAIPIGDTELLAKPSAHVGVMTGLYQSAELNFAAVVSTYGTDGFDRLPYQLGVQGQYKWALASLGYGGSHFSPTANGVSLGLGVALPMSFGDAFLFYSLQFANSGRSDLHAVTAGVRLGGVDTEAPEVVFASEGTHFSPNNDGVRDLMVFTAAATDKSPIVFYEFRVSDAKGNQVFRQRADERIREKEFRWGLFVRSFVAPRARADIPERFTWNGRALVEKQKALKDNVFAEDPPDKALPDGVYIWHFRVMDEKNNESKTLSGEVHIDTKPPAAAVEIGDDLISPNGDGRRDLLPITQDTSVDDAYEGYIENAEGARVRTYRWPENAPARLDFDGRRDNGELVEEGVYRYHLVGSDAAGNRAEAKSENFYVSRRVDAVYLRSSGLGLNPKKSELSEIQFVPSLEHADGFTQGEIRIGKSCGPKAEDVVFRLPVRELGQSAKKNAKKPAKALYAWKGESVSQTTAADGIYCAVFQAQYVNGNAPESPPIKIAIDSTPPQLDVAADLSTRQFAPDGDGENEEQAFRLSVNDQSEIVAYALQVSEILPDEKGIKKIPVRSFRGKGSIPQTIYWDGKTESGALVESLTQYEYTLEAQDSYGNVAVSSPRRFETGVLALPAGNGFLVRVVNADLDEPATDRLAAVARLMEKYPKYKVKVEAHTGTAGGIERNLRLSEQAARKTYEFLIENGVAAERVTYQGFGESSPAFDVRSVNAPKNRRLDFILSR
ncbi:OmpA family protein [Turneriella parva]|nr:OmpA family protein [Turneriella parva]